MNSEDARDLCLNLMVADTEEQVIDLLTKAGCWEKDDFWRNYGDMENNYSTIGNQQSRPDAALVEKLVNSIDACLMNECLLRRINPEDPARAPKSIEEAVAVFFGESKSKQTPHSPVTEWLPSKRMEIAKRITLAATGARGRAGKASFSVADSGEGQTPDTLPDTILSLNRENKLRIPFVQGKFNMGGTGALKFGGRNSLQLVVSRRNPGLVNGSENDSDFMWGFTVVRREYPSEGRRNSIFTYLAPYKADSKPKKGGILRFRSDTLPIFPDEGAEANAGARKYSRESQWGTLIKLYEYDNPGRSNTNILLHDGAKERLDLLLTEAALPIRLYECRNYGGHPGSYSTNLTGINVRLKDENHSNLEPGFPHSCHLKVQGQSMVAKIFAFKKGKARAYRRNEGIIFTVNGQMHAALEDSFFKRKNVYLDYLADSLLVIVDCSQIEGGMREDLFPNSRDRLYRSRLRNEIESRLEEMLHQDQALRDLRERRRREMAESKVKDDKPLIDVLQDLIKRQPTLADLFLFGKRISSPFNASGLGGEKTDYQGKTNPTFFRFKDVNYGEVLYRNCPINHKCRVKFESDAANDFFIRDIDPGTFELFVDQDLPGPDIDNYTGPNLRDGTATLTIELPNQCREGDELRIVTKVHDPTAIEPFTNILVVKVLKAADTNGKKKKHVRDKSQGAEKNGEDKKPGQLGLPQISEVSQAEWNNMSPPFDKYSALRIFHAEAEKGDQQTDQIKDVYEFYINVDNVHLKSYQKTSKKGAPLIKHQFIYGMVLIGLGLLHEHIGNAGPLVPSSESESETADESSFVDKAEVVSKALAPILIPMIQSLGDLSEDDVPSDNESIEAT